MEVVGQVLLEMLPVAQGVVTVAAIVTAGVWFNQKRERYPRAVLAHDIVCVPLSEGAGWLLNVSVSIENRGLVLIELTDGLTRVQQVQPLDSELMNNIKEGLDIVAEGESEVPWRLIAERKAPSEENSAEIEPKETDQILYDFHIPPGVELVSIYTHYPNTKTRGGKGWQLTTLYQLPDTRQGAGE